MKNRFTTPSRRRWLTAWAALTASSASTHAASTNRMDAPPGGSSDEPHKIVFQLNRPRKPTRRPSSIRSAPY